MLRTRRLKYACIVVQMQQRLRSHDQAKVLDKAHVWHRRPAKANKLLGSDRVNSRLQFVRAPSSHLRKIYCESVCSQ